MTDKELKRLSRAELVELLLEQTRRAEALKAELEKTKERLEEKTILLEKSGNIADAALALNQVFETALAAADQYIYNVKLKYGAADEESEH